MSPEQMRKRSEAEAESLKHARYAQADGSFKAHPQQQYSVSPAIDAASRRVDAATDKENKSIGKFDPSPNADVRFEDD